MPALVRFLGGWVVASCLLLATWGITAPVVADKVRVAPEPQLICPLLIIRHGVGSDLKTFTKVRDVCATTDTLQGEFSSE